MNNRCQVAPHLVAICPLRDMVVEVELAVHDAPPPAPSVAPDHEVTCSLDLPTGQLQIHECTGTAVLDQILAPGSYRVRVAFRNLASVSADGMDGQDSYLIELARRGHRPRGHPTLDRAPALSPWHATRTWHCTWHRTQSRHVHALEAGSGASLLPLKPQEAGGTLQLVPDARWEVSVPQIDCMK
ncbi:MAG: hypothetical protein R3E42_10080 [Burkholderiaceae bacterium]